MTGAQLRTLLSSASLTRKRIVKSALIALLLGVLVLLLYSLYLSIKIERRFSGRRWSIPSRVLSDSTLLFPGQRLNRDFFDEKLRRLGYRNVFRDPERKGEMRNSDSDIELYLHDLDSPSLGREGFRVRLRFRGDRIESIWNLDDGSSIPLLELEPEQMALLFGPEREMRQLVSIRQVPESLIHAVLCAEDKRFYQHHGVDPRGIVRALFANIRHGGILQGGSTITQQLAKCYFLYPKRSFSRKLREILMSLIIEIKYEKDEILEIYLNEIYLGQRGSVSINGVGEASQFYFGKGVEELTISEAACLAGLIKAPNHYSPYIDKERCRDQRDKVLRTMRENGWISDEELETALTSPISTVGYTASGRKAPYFIDYLLEQLTDLYPAEALSSLGLSIYTTLDTQVQMAAERALERGLRRIEESIPSVSRQEIDGKLQGAVIVLHPKTGYILAMVGGRDYATSQFNRATHSRRQPGSAFKPFVFLSGLDKFTLASQLSNAPVSFEVNGQLWEPHNFEPVPEQHLSVREALAKSVNLAAVDLATKVGFEHIVETASAFGFSTPIKPYPSIALGAFEVIPIDLARAYCAFAADGVLPYPLSLKKVVDENGSTLERRHMTIERAISPQKAFLMTSLLRSVVTDGTARLLLERGLTFPIAGKTGTTNDYRDGWFVGYTPDILALVWVGFDNESSIHKTAAGAALPIWADLIESLPQYITYDWFTMPPGIVKRKVCTESGQLATRSCPARKEEVFLTDNVPTEYCVLHRGKNPFTQIMEERGDIIKSF